MKFSTRQDTDLSSEALFQSISDFGRIERLLVRRGASVRRTDSLTQNGVGMGWMVGFDWRGKRRDLSLELTRYEPPGVIRINGQSELFLIELQMTVVALTPTKSRLIFEADIQPRGMKARLLLQTAKLGKAQLDRKFALRIAEFVNDLAMNPRLG
ncbi:SRPBCC family protein [Paracoccus sulfuroxidans]|uniref:Polyketide cyclase/dehydrase/lipid transport protein n=1 Tax=Paracoccus sulfuroxidans TaxID=384678 RepID=A0A562NWY8_9RHOB|nr:SRPBCC family protein [Paracoccus sulfuroxidans]TWI36748.1 hypothetical protein IQ24_00530 [Paracoccus sulfuroxidans]